MENAKRTMQTIHPPLARRALRARAGTLLSLALGLSAAPSWAQDPPAQPAPVPGAGEAAAQASQSGSGATTGAGSDPISATTMMRATRTPAASGGSKKASKKNRGKKAAAGSVEPWFGRRVLLLLPLQIGPGFNADRAFGQAILSRAEAQLQSELEATGKFSVIRAHRFSPLIQRALQEKRLTPDEAEGVIEGLPAGADPATAVDDPVTVQGANTFLNRFTFDQLPMIAQFNLEEVRSSAVNGRPGVQAQVSGRLYEARNPVALKSPVLTSDTVVKGRNNIERYLEAARLAFGSVADEFVAPLEDITLPQAGGTSSNAANSSTTPAPSAQPAPDNSMGTPDPALSPAPAPLSAPPAQEALPIPAPEPAPAEPAPAEPAPAEPAPAEPAPAEPAPAEPAPAEPAPAEPAPAEPAPGVAPGTEPPAAGG